MENFVKPFLENGVGYSLLKAPISVDDNSEQSIIKFLKKIIFKHDVLVELKQLLNSAGSSEPFNVKNVVIKKLIKGLNVVLLSDEDIKNKTDVFRYVFQSFVSSFTGDENLHVVQFFLVLSQLVGINAVLNVNDNKDSSDSIINEENFRNGFEVDTPSLSPESFIIFKELLLCLSKTFINFNPVEFQPYNKWLQHVIKNLASSRPFLNIFMEIFYIVAEIDIKLLEGNLDCIFCNILVQGLSDDDNFSEIYGDFLVKTLKISAQFQRTVKFVSKFLSSIKITPTSLPNEAILPLNFVSEFSKIVSFASNQQSLSLLDVLVQCTDECFNLISQKNLGCESTLLFITSKLLICFFKDVKLYAPSIALTTLQAFINKMNGIKEALQKFGHFLFSNKSFAFKNENIVKSFLELCFYCGEIEILVNCYKDSILHPSDLKEPSVNCDWQCCISSEQWKKLVNFVLKSKLANCDLQCFQLAMQKLRACKLENISLTEDSTVKIIIHQMTSDLNIFQQVPPEDFIILINVLTVEQSKTVMGNLLNQIQENDRKSEWTTWISDSAIEENPIFISYLFSGLLKSAGSFLQETISDKHHSKISWFSDDYFDECNSVSDEVLERLPEKINVLLKSGYKLRKLITNRWPLVKIVEVFKLLPLFYMKEGFRRLGLSFAVGMGTLLADEENGACLTFESIYNFLTSDTDASVCFNIGLFIRFLTEFCYQSKRTNVIKLKLIECLVRNSPKMKFGLNQMEEMTASANSFKRTSLMSMLETRIVLYNELGKCWQRAKKRKSDNDLIGSYRTKLAKLISEESTELSNGEDINPENSEILLKTLAIEINKAVRLNEENDVKNLMEQKFPKYFDFAVKNLKEDFDESSVMFLTIVLQSMPQVRKYLPENSVLKIWKALKTQEKVNWKLFCINSTEEEFNEILTDLLKISQKFLYSKSDKYSFNCFEIWASFFESSTNKKKNSCQLRLQEFFNYIYDCDLFLKDLPVGKKVFLMKFFHFCVTTKGIILTSHVLDTIIHVIFECFDDSSSIDDFCNLFTVEAEVASAILTRQFSWSRSKIHLNLLMFQRLLKSLMGRCDTDQQINNDDVIKLSTCAFCLEKWASMMVRKEKDFARISAYFITALVSSIASVTVLPAIKIHLTNCINHFLSTSDSHTVAYLMRILKPGYQQVFNSLYVQFNKYHKYSGKI